MTLLDHNFNASANIILKFDDNYVFYLLIILARLIEINSVTCLSCHTYVLMISYSLKWISQQNDVEGNFWSAN